MFIYTLDCITDVSDDTTNGAKRVTNSHISRSNINLWWCEYYLRRFMRYNTMEQLGEENSVGILWIWDIWSTSICVLMILGVQTHGLSACDIRPWYVRDNIPLSVPIHEYKARGKSTTTWSRVVCISWYNQALSHLHHGHLPMFCIFGYY